MVKQKHIWSFYKSLDFLLLSSMWWILHALRWESYIVLPFISSSYYALYCIAVHIIMLLYLVLYCIKDTEMYFHETYIIYTWLLQYIILYNVVFVVEYVMNLARLKVRELYCIAVHIIMLLYLVLYCIKDTEMYFHETYIMYTSLL